MTVRSLAAARPFLVLESFRKQRHGENMMAIGMVVRQDGWRKFRNWAVLSVVASIIAATSCFAEDIRVFSGGAPREALRALAQEFEKSTGHKVQFTYLVDSAIQKRLAGG